MAEMAAPSNNSKEVDACPMLKEEPTRNIEGGRYNWSSAQKGIILGAFYWGYLLGHLPGGWLADKLGPRHVLGGSMLGLILLTFFYPIAVETNIFTIAVLLRILVGVCYGPIYPCLSAFIGRWIPPRHRNLLGSLTYAGAYLGSITGTVLTGIMIGWTRSWKTPFYVWSSFGILWYIFYLFMVFSSPETHPFITKDELDFLRKEVPKRVIFKVPWKAIMTSPTTYALMCGQFGHDYVIYTILTVLPTFMKLILKLSIERNAIFNGMPFIFFVFSTVISGCIADSVIENKSLSVLGVRRVWTAVSSIIPGFLLLAITYVGCNRMVILMLYSFVMLFKGVFYAGMKLNINDVTIYYGGIVCALANGVGATAGVLGPTVVGILTKNQSMYEWRVVMWTVVVVQFITIYIYCEFTSAERQPWDYPEDQPQEINK